MNDGWVDLPVGAGGTVIRACAYNGSELFGQRVAAQTALKAVLGDVGPYVTGEPVLYDVVSDVMATVDRLYGPSGIAGPDSPAVESVRAALHRFGVHGRMVVCAVGVIDGYAAARTELDALRAEADHG